MRTWFLSYNSVDLPVAEQLEGLLRERIPDASVFFAPKALRAGGYWLPKLAEAIAAADAFILYVGEHGLGPWQVIEYYEALDRRVKEPDFPVVLVLLDGHPAPGLPFLRQLHWIVTADPTSTETIGQLKDATAGGGSRPGELWRYTAPYRGLAAMSEADSDFFFGRDQQTVDVIQAIGADQERLAVLIGNSGVGKSSLAQAGVLGALKRQAYPDSVDPGTQWPRLFRDSRHWCFLKMQPGTEPIKALVEPFLKTWQFDATDPKWEERRTDWITALTAGKATLSGLLDATERRYEELGQPKPPAFFLYVDQAEELYVRSEESQRAGFSQMLADAIADPRLFGLMSLRSDFFGSLQNDQPLFAIHRQINVPPLRESELNEVVGKPAALLSARFEADRLAADLARRAAEESAKDAGALPLLSYLLDDMWTDMIRRGDGVLRVPPQAFELGGVLADRADAYLDNHPESENTLRRILTLKLATVREDGEPTRRRALRSEFPDDEWSMVSELADHPHRLLVTATPEDGEIYAEVAHEAIFRRWTKLREWIAAEREFLSWRSRLEGARRAWAAAPAHACNDALLMGLALGEAQQWIARRPDDLPAVDRNFIEKSIAREGQELAERERDRRRRRMLRIATAALVLVTALASFSVYAMFDIARQRDQVQQQRALAETRGSEAEQQRMLAEKASAEAAIQKAQAEQTLSVTKVALDKLIVEFGSSRKILAGMGVETITAVLDTLRSTVDQLAEAAPHDADLQGIRAEMFDAFSETYLAAGDVKEAIAAAGQGLEIARKLFADHPDDLLAESDVAIGLERLGDARLQAGDTTGALQAHQARLDVARHLVERQPGVAAPQRDVSVALNKVGDVKLRAGDMDGALSAYQESIDIARRQVDAAPDDAGAQRDLSVSLNKMGDLQAASGDNTEALIPYLQSLDIRRKLAARPSGDDEATRDLTVTLTRLGDAQLATNRQAAALASFEESLVLTRKLLAADPGNARAQRDVVISLNKIGIVRMRADDRAGAFAAFNEGLGMTRAMVARDPGNAVAETDLVFSLSRVGDVSDDPAPFYGEALGILRKLDGEGRLSAEQKGWGDWLVKRLPAVGQPIEPAKASAQ